MNYINALLALTIAIPLVAMDDMDIEHSKKRRRSVEIAEKIHKQKTDHEPTIEPQSIGTTLQAVQDFYRNQDKENILQFYNAIANKFTKSFSLSYPTVPDNDDGELAQWFAENNQYPQSSEK